MCRFRFDRRPEPVADGVAGVIMLADALENPAIGGAFVDALAEKIQTSQLVNFLRPMR